MVNIDGKAQPPNQNEVKIGKDGQKPQEDPGQRIPRTGQPEGYGGVGNGKGHDGLSFKFHVSSSRFQDNKFQLEGSKLNGVSGDLRRGFGAARDMKRSTLIVQLFQLESFHGGFYLFRNLFVILFRPEVQGRSDSDLDLSALGPLMMNGINSMESL